MNDIELIQMLRNNVGVSKAACDAAYEAADRIEELSAALTESCAETAAAREQGMRDAVGPLMEALRVLIDHTHECERELTEALHHADFCGESRPLTDARATLAAAKAVTKETKE